MTPYTAQQWVEDFSQIAPLPYQPGATPPVVATQMRLYFARKYPDEYVDRFVRFQRAMQFLDQHFHELIQGRAGVAGEKKALVRPSLVLALHEYFAALTDEEIEHWPTVAQISELAKGHTA